MQLPIVEKTLLLVKLLPLLYQSWIAEIIEAKMDKTFNWILFNSSIQPQASDLHKPLKISSLFLYLCSWTMLVTKANTPIKWPISLIIIGAFSIVLLFLSLLLLK